MRELVKQYLRSDFANKKRRTIFCPGCGDGQVLGYFIQAVDELKKEGKIDDSKLYLLGGIGCSGWIPTYLKYNTVHTLHGRAIPVAVGIKLTNPEAEVVVFTGDGDNLSIGLNHFVQALRRNVGIKVIMLNNMLYGMTGGQVAPTTPMNAITHTTPYGNVERPIDACKLAVDLGAGYVARWPTILAPYAVKSIKELLTHKGFGFVEFLSQCPTYQGRYVFNVDDPANLMNYYLKITYRSNKIDDKDSRIAIGTFANFESTKPTYEELIWNTLQKTEGERK